MFSQVAVHRAPSHTLNKKICIYITLLFVNVLTVEYCFFVSLGGTTVKYVIMAALLFEDDSPSHVAHCSAVLKCLVYFYVCGFSSDGC